jgi:hypothetical protein
MLFFIVSDLSETLNRKLPEGHSPHLQMGSEQFHIKAILLRHVLQALRSLHPRQGSVALAGGCFYSPSFSRASWASGLS